ncbi:MAG TPA: hypothetical protein VFI58_19555 [Xanthobacteraceae bacterium]|jgi:hypothetical protein|nr:hypothetical protein [Xanthobacteraceae bacterium]
MRTKTKIWLGVGAFVVIETAATGGSARLGPETFAWLSARPHLPAVAAAAGRMHVAQDADHARDAGEGGEAGTLAGLPPELAFAVRVALLRGHLLVGDELVKQQQWNAALPHFLHPTEEIYGDIQGELAGYNVPRFDGALKALAQVVKGRKGGADYVKALKAVNDALAAADAGMKARQSNWSGFVVEAAVEALKAASGEYQQAIVGGRIAKPVEYQDARGFVWEAERMIDSVAADLQKQNAPALREVRAGMAELKLAFPSPIPPRTPVRDHATLLGDVSRIELAAGKLM